MMKECFQVFQHLGFTHWSLHMMMHMGLISVIEENPDSMVIEKNSQGINFLEFWDWDI